MAEPAKAASVAPVFIDYYPQQRLGTVTLDESWAVDDGHTCWGTFPSKAEAVAYAERVVSKRVIVRSDKPTANGDGGAS